MSLRDAEAALPKKRVPTIHKGIEPSIKWNGKEGYIDTPLLDQEPDESIWADVIQDWGLDPKFTEIVDGSVHIRGWDTNVGGGEIRRMRYYRASIKRREAGDDRADIEALCALVAKHKTPKKTLPAGTGNRAFLCVLSDWQLGKNEGGGSEATTERILLAYDKIVYRLIELIKKGHAPSVIYVAGLGDLIEQCAGHYAMQTANTDLDRRSQMRLARRLILKLIDLLVDKFDIPIVLLAVPGNHGENRNASGRAFTTWLDNDDLAVFEQVGEICLGNPERYANVHVPDFDEILNNDDLSATVEIAGVPVSFIHGHQCAKSGKSQTKLENWLTGQVMGRTPVSQCAILFSGHLHHFVCSEATGRTIFQSPAMDGGSNWFTSNTGQNSPAGMITIGIGLDYGVRGWGDLEVL